MNKLIHVLAILLLAGTVAFADGPGITVADCPPNNALGCVYLGPLTQNPTHQFYSNSGAIINRFNDRVFGGGATTNTGTSANTNADWLGAMHTAHYNGGDGIIDNGDFSQWYVLTDSTSPSVATALTLGSQTLNATGLGGSFYPLNLVSVCNNATYAIPCWGVYVETHRVTNTAGSASGGEYEVRNSGNTIVADPYNFSQVGEVAGISIGSGAGLSSTGQTNSTMALGIFPNPTSFNSGIIFQNGSVAASGPGGATPAIAMPANYEIDWYTATGALGARIYSNIYGTFTVVGNFYQSGNQQILGNLLVNGHVQFDGFTPPAVSSCGATTTVDTGGSDAAGSVSIPAGTTACTITFATAFTGTKLPVVILTGSAALADVHLSARSLSAFTITQTSLAGANDVEWIVVQ